MAFVDLVFQVHRQFPGIDLAAGELARVGREPGHFHVAEDDADVGKGLGIGGVELAVDLGSAVVVHPAVELYLSAGILDRGDAGHDPLELVDLGAERRGQAEIGKIDFALGDEDAADTVGEGIIAGGRRRFCGCRGLF